jgi:predicted nucleic acid-binding protein
MKQQKQKNLILDSWSLLAYFKKERAGLAVEKLLRQAEKGKINLFFSFINWGEIYYQILRRFGRPRLRKVMVVIEELPIKLVKIDKELIILAAEKKAKRGLSFADCFVAALAKKLKGTIVTGDPEFKNLDEKIEILWLL